VVGAFIVANRFLKVAHALCGRLRNQQTRPCSRRFSQAVTSGIVARQLQTCWKVFEAPLVDAFVQLRQRDPKIRVGKPAPFAGLAKMLERALGIIERNRILTNAAIDPG
jgi:hypothetical protein